ncbi:MAG: alpha/beta hydrolase [Deltaproteobacteria bacterium]|nr:alpha/beta hydrolase [Kofleriaceae bacterium]
MPSLVHALENGMSVRSRGSGSRVLVWVHGLGESGRCFDRIASHPHLWPYRHVVVDLPGYGRSPWPASSRSIEETADELAAWLEARDDNAVLVGHSLGGVIATVVAERHPDTVRAVIDVEGNASLGDCTYSNRIAAVDEAEFTTGGYDLLWQELWVEAGEDAALRSYAASMAFADPWVMWRHATDLVALSRSETLAARRGKLAVPLLFIAGAPRGICDRSRGLLLDAGVRIADVSPAGHWPYVDRAEPFAEIVARFVESLPE